MVEEANGNARLRIGILRPIYKRIAEEMAILALLKYARGRELPSGSTVPACTLKIIVKSILFIVVIGMIIRLP